MSTRELLRLPQGPVDLRDLPTGATPGFAGDKVAGKAALRGLGPELAELQQRLFAARHAEGDRVLLVLQGMDTSGKGGVLKKVVGLLDPHGVRTTAFGVPTEDERAEHWLARVRRALPGPGLVGAFDRSHYEDLLVPRVQGELDDAALDARVAEVVAFEADLVASGTRLVKVFLHLSPQEQRERLLARLDDPAKRWKFDPADLDARARWDDYRTAYERVLAATGAAAPWYVVPADRKWFRSLAVARLLLEELQELDPHWPEPTYDVDEQRRRLLAERRPGEGTP
jgi:PPK2 family polyphosphate:nucleotide phosphotransferase